MIFSGKKRNPPKREEFLKNALKETQKSFENATNMAGRGTDIMLGGNVEFMANCLFMR